MKNIKDFLILIIAGIGILFDIFIFRFTSDLLILFLVGLWIILIRRYKFEGRVSIGLALGLLILCPFLLILGKEPIVGKISIWVYLFLAVGSIQMFIENVKDTKELKD